MDEVPIFKTTISVHHHASKKNSKEVYFNPKTGRRFVGSNNRVKKAEDLLLLQLRSRALDLGLEKPFNCRMRGVFVFVFTRDVYYTQSLTESRRMGDCSNLVQIVEDALQKAGIIEDDFLLAPITIDRVCGDEMCVKIELYKYNPTHEQMSFDEGK